MIHEVTGCDPLTDYQCPFLRYGKYGDPYCGHPSAVELDLNEREIDEDGGNRIKTPAACPLKKEDIIIKLKIK